MDVRFCEGRNHRREAHVRAAGSDSFTSARSSEARVRRNLFLLDKRLTWMSANRKLSCFHGGISPVKSACGKLEAPLAFAGDCRRVTGYRNNRPEPSASSATPAWHDLWALWSLDDLTLPPILKVEPT